jgi:RNA polymerase sigma-70 factor (sigma-E family)
LDGSSADSVVAAADTVLDAPAADVLQAPEISANANGQHGPSVLDGRAGAAVASDQAAGDGLASVSADGTLTAPAAPAAPGGTSADGVMPGRTGTPDEISAEHFDGNGTTYVTADGEPTETGARPTNVAETLVVDVLVPEVRSAPSVWDADRVVTEIYHGEYKSLVRLAVLLVHDVPTAEEVVQDAFEAMHTAWRRLRDSEKALSYLRQAVVNKSRSVLRHRTVVDRNAPKPAPDEPSAEHGALALIERSAVVAALRTLPDRQREAIVLRYYADLSEADIAATMGISRGAVKSHTARAMAALKSILEQETS